MKPVIRSGILSVVVTIATAMSGSALAQGKPDQLPEEAKTVIAQVQAAASAKNFNAIRGLMVEEFLWSFGGDGDADQAIEAWKGDATYLKEMAAVLKRGCRLKDQKSINCPGKGNGSFRAGFAKTNEGWRMGYFVAGD